MNEFHYLSRRFVWRMFVANSTRNHRTASRMWDMAKHYAMLARRFP